MEFEVKRAENPNISKYSKDDLTLAYEFSKKLHEEFGTLLKAVVLFGSATRRKKLNPGEEKGDIDLLIIVDDTTIVLSADIVETYRILMDKIVAETSNKIHVTSLKLSSFWEFVKAGDPVAINILREGVSLLDTGFFDPLQVLLMTGRIRPTPEAIQTYFMRAPRTLYNSKWHLLQATLDLYWAVIDAAHAALMKLGETPPSPEDVADLMDRVMVQKKIVPRKYAETMRFFYKLSKMITYREMKEVTGRDYEKFLAHAQDFVTTMEKVIKKK